MRLLSSNSKSSNRFWTLRSRPSSEKIFLDPKRKPFAIREITPIHRSFVTQRRSPSRRTRTPWDCPVAAGCATRASDCAWPARRWPSAVAGPVWPSTGTSCETCSWTRPRASRRRRPGRTAAAAGAPSAPWPTACSPSPGGAGARPLAAARSRAWRRRRPRPRRRCRRRRSPSPRPVARGGPHRRRPPPKPRFQTRGKTWRVACVFSGWTCRNEGNNRVSTVSRVAPDAHLQKNRKKKRARQIRDKNMTGWKNFQTPPSVLRDRRFQKQSSKRGFFLREKSFFRNHRC